MKEEIEWLQKVTKVNKLKKKIELIKKAITDWKVIITANSREVKEKDEI